MIRAKDIYAVESFNGLDYTNSHAVRMTENSLCIYCDGDVIEITQANALNFELAANIITGNRKDEYDNNDEDYKV